MNKIERAHLAVEAAENALADAQAALADAKASRDVALAEVGWRRLVGGFSPSATPLYASDAHPDALPLDVVLERQREAVA